MSIYIKATVICAASLWGAEGTVRYINKQDAIKYKSKWSKCLDYDIDEEGVDPIQHTEVLNNITNFKVNDNMRKSGCGC